MNKAFLLYDSLISILILSIFILFFIKVIDIEQKLVVNIRADISTTKSLKKEFYDKN